MKNLRTGPVLLLVAGVALASIAWRAKGPDYVVPGHAGVVPVTLEGEIPEGCEVRRFEVEGICCPGCGEKLHKAMAGIEGVRKLAVDPVTKQVMVLVRSEVDEERLTSALTFDEFVAHPR